MRSLRLVACVLAGSVVAIWLDYLHATHGVTRYMRADLFGVQPWWVPVLFTSATLAAVLMVEPVRRALGGAPPQVPSLWRLAADYAAFVGVYALTSFMPEHPTLLLLILVGAWAVRTIGLMPGWVIAYSLLAAASGFAAESTLVALGQFAYVHPDVLGVARWLPGIYLHVGVLGTTFSALVAGDRQDA